MNGYGDESGEQHDNNSSRPPVAHEAPLGPDAVATERTSLAWERTGFAMMAAGVVLSRAAVERHGWPAAMVGVAQTAGGASLLVWAGRLDSSRRLHIAAGRCVAHPLTTSLVGAATTAFTVVAFIIGLTTL